MPAVSVIIPIYNVEAYLKQCLDSVINQTLNDIEIILVDDGSTDNSGKILDLYALKDKRIKVIHQRNKGAAVARNVGLSLAVGDYISILDSDDVFDKNMLQLLYNRAVSTEADVTICRCQELDAQTGAIVQANYTLNHVPNKDVFNRKDLGSYVFEFTVGWSWDKLYKHNFLKDLNIKFQNLRSTNDAYFVFMTICLANRITCINDVLITHRTNLMTSLSMTRDKDPFCFLTACNKIRHDLIKKRIYKYLEQSYVNWFVAFSFWHLDTLKDKNNRIRLARKLRNTIFSSIGIYELNQDYFHNNALYDRLHSGEFDKYKTWRTKLIEHMLKKTRANKRTAYKIFGFIPLLSIEEK